MEKVWKEAKAGVAFASFVYARSLRAAGGAGKWHNLTKGIEQRKNKCYNKRDQ